MSRLTPASCSYPALLSGLFIFFGWGQATLAQTYETTPEASATLSGSIPAIGVFNVIAVRLEFDPDTSRFTTGDGTFDGDPYQGLVPRVDPLPHDADFFTAHLDALSNYIERVSDGRVTLNTMLLPNVVRVGGQMAEYSPIGLDASSDQQLTKLAGLVSEGWTSADNQTSINLSSLDPARTFFILFHAGVGRDIELVGTTLEKTPLDLPSIYFGTGRLRQLGVPALSIGGLEVSNTAIIPRTETRRGFDFFSDSFFLAELTTNGLLASSFLNFLGVPDLFDTLTGESAIGPFGIMDPLGIFAYGGLLPPEPSAWTKLFLGWADPVDVLPGVDADLQLRSTSARTSSDLARVRISSSEYFLVENRHRDPDSDGLTLTIWHEGVVKQQHFDNGDPTFNGQTIEGFGGGVVISADDYDWSLPGGLDQDGNALLGGALIWHVDERVIAERLPANMVNADPNNRGVDLEEADSGQDLGRSQPGLLGPQLNLGSPFDYYYLGNPVSAITPSGRNVALYTNRFGPDTFPSSHTNAGGPSFVSIEDFSSAGPIMTLSVKWVSEQGIEPVDGWPVEAGSGFASGVVLGGAGGALTMCGDGESRFVAALITAHDQPANGVAVLSIDGSVETIFPSGLLPTAIACRSGRMLLVTALDGYNLVEVTQDGEQTRQWSLPVSTAFPPPMRTILEGDVATVVFQNDGSTEIVSIDLAAEVVLTGAVTGSATAWGYAGDGTIAIGNESGFEVYRNDGTPADDSDLHRWSFTDQNTPVGEPAFGRDSGGLSGASVLLDGRLALLGSDGLVRVADTQRDLGLGPVTGESPVVVDLDLDGRLDFMVSAGSTLVAFTQGGAVVNGFPIRLRAAVYGQPLVVHDVENSSSTVVAAAADGYVYAFDLGRDGKPKPGFPLAVGGRIEATPFAEVIDGAGSGQTMIRIYAASTSATVASWNVPAFDGSLWPGRYGNNNQAFARLAQPGPAEPETRLLVAKETYNWPNPVVDGRTRFRFLATDDCRVTITIVDLTGAAIDEIEIQNVQGGSPAEVVWTTSAGSGLYFARVRARTDTGREDDMLIKVAIVR